MSENTSLVEQARRLSVFLASLSLDAKGQHREGINEAALAFVRLADRVQELEGKAPPSSVQPEKERRPLSDEMVLRAARELCKIHAGECQVNEQDTWNIYADQFKRDARAALEAAHGIPPSPSMVGREGEES